MENILFLTDLDGTFLNDKKEVGQCSVDILNRLIEKGLKFSVCSARTPATMTGILKDLRLNLPVCAMNGAAVYDMEKNEYTHIYTIDKEAVGDIVLRCKKAGLSPFIHVIRDGRLYIYFENTESEAAAEFYEERKNLSGKTYIRAPYNEHKDGGDVIYFTLLGEEKKVSEIYDDIKTSHISRLVSLNFYRDIYNEGYCFLEICDRAASKETSLRFLKELSEADKVYAFGDNYNDLPMLREADLSFAVENAPEDIRRLCDRVIGDNNTDSVAKTIESIFEERKKL